VLTTVGCPSTSTCIALDNAGNAVIGHPTPPPTADQIRAALRQQISLIAKRARIRPQRLWPSDHLGLEAQFALHRTPVTLMSYNIFQGSELSHSFATTTRAQLGPAIAADYDNVLQSNIPARAKALAAEIQQDRPVAIGLQEAVLWRTRTPAGQEPYALPGDATHVSYDFVKLLLGELAARGAHYRAVAIANNLDVQAPGDFLQANKMDVRYTDRVTILVRRGVSVSNVQEHNYTVEDAVHVIGFQLPVPDGWASVDLKVGSRRFRFITTRLDGLNDPRSNGVPAAQAREIISGPAHTKLPVIFTCDCNSTPATRTHQELVAAGLRDSWGSLHPHLAGPTCCHRSSPSDPETDVADPHPHQGIVERSDYIWSGSPFATLGIKLVGLNPADRALVRRRAFSTTFNAPGAGVFTEKWYRSRGKRKPLLIAAGASTFASGGSEPVDITLTQAGRHLLRTATPPVRITVVASFTPFVEPGVTISTGTALRR
jgi:hypothetical protein